MTMTYYRGAQMGRAAKVPAVGGTPLLRLAQVRIDRGGYADDGTYWGIGRPLWRAWDADGTTEVHVRAVSRGGAIDAVRAIVPGARFHRGG